MSQDNMSLEFLRGSSGMCRRKSPLLKITLGYGIFRKVFQIKAYSGRLQIKCDSDLELTCDRDMNVKAEAVELKVEELQVQAGSIIYLDPEPDDVEDEGEGHFRFKL